MKAFKTNLPKIIKFILKLINTGLTKNAEVEESASQHYLHL